MKCIGVKLIVREGKEGKRRANEIIFVIIGKSVCLIESKRRLEVFGQINV
jgi:hypothetical protein